MKKIPLLLKPLWLVIVAGIISAVLPAGAQSVWNPTSGINWSTTANWLPTAVPNLGTNVLFDDLGNASTIDNIVDTSLIIGSLQYGQTNGFHNTQINAGVTLTVSNNMTTNIMFVAGTETDNGSTQAETNTISGAGSLVINNTNAGAVIIVRQGSLNAGVHESTLDMSGLNTFTTSISLLHVGVEVEVTNDFEVGEMTNDIQRPLGNWLLAKTNIITATGGVAAPPAAPPAIDIGDGHVNGGNGILQLGITNAMYADTMSVGYLKSRTLSGGLPLTGSFLQFNPSFTNGATPSLYLRGYSASRVSFLSVGDNDGTGGNVLTTGNLNLSGGTVDALVDTCYIGRGEATNGTGTAAGTLTFGAGIFDINTMELGYVSTNIAVAGVAGTVNVNGSATLRVNNYLRLGQNPGASVTAKGVLNINGGTVLANTILSGSGITNTINLNGGILVVTNTAGTTAVPIGTLSLSSSGTLQLNVNGGSHVTNVVVTGMANTGTTTIKIGSLAAVTTGVTYPLIGYTGTDPFSTGSFNLVLPSGYVGGLADNTGVVGLTLTTVPVTQPAHFTSISVKGTTLTISATNGADGGQYVLLGTTNLTKPLSQWTPILTNNFDGGGNLNLSTNVVNPAVPQQFYILSE